MQRKIFILIFTVIIFLPFFTEIGGTPFIKPGRSLFDEPSSPFAQTIPVSFLFVSFYFAGWLLIGLVKQKNKLSGLKSAVGFLILIYLAWFFVLALSQSIFKASSIFWFLQSALVILSFYVTVSLIKTKKQIIFFIKIAHFIAITVIVLHLASSFLEQGFLQTFTNRLTDNIFGLKIYQHRSYYPLSLVCIFILSTTTHYIYSIKLPFFKLSVACLFLFVLASGVRGSLAVLILSLAMQFILIRKTRLIFILIFLAMLPAAYYLHLHYDINIATITRLADTINTDNIDESFGARPAKFKEGLAVFNESPIWGAGISIQCNPHNAYLDTAIRTGIVGLFIFLSILIISIYKSYLLFKSTPDNLLKGVALGIFICLICVALISNNLRIPFRQPYSAIILWSYLGLLESCRRINICLKKEPVSKTGQDTT